MKKAASLLLAFSLVFACAACDAFGSSSRQESESAQATAEISYGEKYICGFDEEEAFAKQRYFILQEDGTAEYHHYAVVQENFGGLYYSVSAYTIYLKYQFNEEDDTISCYYDGDGIVYDDVDTKKEDNVFFFVTLTYGEGFLAEENGTVYVTHSS